MAANPLVQVFLGSSSDREMAEHTHTRLDSFGIPHQITIRLGLETRHSPGRDRPQHDLTDQEITELIKKARAKVKEIETAIELARLPPFID